MGIRAAIVPLKWFDRLTMSGRRRADGQVRFMHKVTKSDIPTPLDKDWEQWDSEFEEDVKAGKLDAMAAEVLEAKSNGELKAL